MRAVLLVTLVEDGEPDRLVLHAEMPVPMGATLPALLAAMGAAIIETAQGFAKGAPPEFVEVSASSRGVPRDAVAIPGVRVPEPTGDS